MSDVFGPYDNGAGQTVHADPFELDLALREALQDDPANVQRQTASADLAISIPAKRKLIAGIRKAFRLAPFDPATGKGATGEHCKAIWAQWAEYRAKKNGTGESAQTSMPPASAEPPRGTPSPPEIASRFGFTSPE